MQGYEASGSLFEYLNDLNIDCLFESDINQGCNSCEFELRIPVTEIDSGYHEVSFVFIDYSETS